VPADGSVCASAHAPSSTGAAVSATLPPHLPRHTLRLSPRPGPRLQTLADASARRAPRAPPEWRTALGRGPAKRARSVRPCRAPGTLAGGLGRTRRTRRPTRLRRPPRPTCPRPLAGRGRTRPPRRDPRPRPPRRRARRTLPTRPLRAPAGRRRAAAGACCYPWGSQVLSQIRLRSKTRVAQCSSRMRAC